MCSWARQHQMRHRQISALPSWLFQRHPMKYPSRSKAWQSRLHLLEWGSFACPSFGLTSEEYPRSGAYFPSRRAQEKTFRFPWQDEDLSMLLLLPPQRRRRQQVSSADVSLPWPSFSSPLRPPGPSALELHSCCAWDRRYSSRRTMDREACPCLPRPGGYATSDTFHTGPSDRRLHRNHHLHHRKLCWKNVESLGLPSSCHLST